jgi:hypothetical protein
MAAVLTASKPGSLRGGRMRRSNRNGGCFEVFQDQRLLNGSAMDDAVGMLAS